MKKIFLAFMLLLGCDNSSNNNAAPVNPCGSRAERCFNPTTIVLKGADGLNVVGNIGDIKTVSITLSDDGTFYSKEFKEMSAINIAKQFNFAFPKENTEQIANLEVTGFITMTFITSDKKLEIRDFSIENGTIIRDILYPEVIYSPSTTLDVEWLNKQVE